MPAGQLQFNQMTAIPYYACTIGIDQYVIVRPVAANVNPQFVGLFVGTGSVRSLGGFDRLNDAVNACQTDFNSLGT